jgi:AcrR family transcriptional regulator
MARPRSEHAHRAAIDATLQVLLEAGVEGVTLEDVAARSGVAKSTLYRHFDSREGLIRRSLESCMVEIATPDTGSLASDLRALMERFSAESQRTINDLLPLLIDAAGRDEEIDALVAAIVAERRRPLRTILQLAQLRGEIGADLDLDTAVAIVIGPITYRKTVERREVTPEFKEAVLTSAIAGLRATAGAPAAIA